LLNFIHDATTKLLWKALFTMIRKQSTKILVIAIDVFIMDFPLNLTIKQFNDEFLRIEQVIFHD